MSTLISRSLRALNDLPRILPFPRLPFHSTATTRYYKNWYTVKQRPATCRQVFQFQSRISRVGLSGLTILPAGDGKVFILYSRFVCSIPLLRLLSTVCCLPRRVGACVYRCICISISIYVNIRICMYMSMYVCMGMPTSTLPAALYAMGAFKPLVLSAHVCHLLSPSPCLTSSV